MSKKIVLATLSSILLSSGGTHAWLSSSLKSSSIVRGDFSFDYATLPQGCKAYIARLPKLEAEGLETTAEKVRAIFEYVQKFDPTSKISEETRQETFRKIERCIKTGKKLEMEMLGFSSKSSNTVTKVLGTTFDLADYMGLYTLNHIAKNIEKAHPPGVILVIHHIEPFLADMNKYLEAAIGVPIVDPKAIIEYKATLKRIVRNFPFLTLAEDLTNVYQGELHKKESDSKETLNDRPFDGYAAFFKGELNHPRITNAIEETQLRRLGKKASKTQLKKSLDALAKGLAQVYDHGVNRFRRVLVQRSGTETLRLSIHGSSQRLGISTIYGHPAAPWHNALRVTNSNVALIKKEDIGKDDAVHDVILCENELTYVEAIPKTSRKFVGLWSGD